MTLLPVFLVLVATAVHARKLLQTIPNGQLLVDASQNNVLGSLPNNPYGIVVMPADAPNNPSTLLLSVWNSPTNNDFGQGNIIYKYTPTTKKISVFKKFSTNPAPGACAADGAGVGLTMGFAYFAPGYLVQASTPISTVNNPNLIASPGCLIFMDTLGHIVFTYAGPGVHGIWGGTSFVNSTGAVSLFFSNVLGTRTNTNKELTGFISRFTFTPPPLNTVWNDGVIGSPTNVSAHIATKPALINAGAVGPSGITIDNSGNMYWADTLANEIFKVPNAVTCKPAPNQCAGFQVLNITKGCLNMPIGLNLELPNKDFLLTVNGGDGNACEFSVNGGAFNKRTINTEGAGTNFNIVTGLKGQAVFFNNDAENNLHSLTMM